MLGVECWEMYGGGCKGVMGVREGWGADNGTIWSVRSSRVSQPPSRPPQPRKLNPITRAAAEMAPIHRLH